MRATSTSTKTLRSDNKGRVCIGTMVPEGITSFRAHVDKNHRIILEPLVEVAVRTLLEKVRRNEPSSKEKSTSKVPNKKLLKSFKDYEQGKGLTKHKDFDSFLKSFGR